ncbi:hypothetical protein GCM10023264_06260 [Sphingomonas daechungensis]|uniref:TonB family protein n=1 Tax=Sphingomonas daechungensis TaxID=1176646 RepID=A0ABX6T096_9SPHN|nr:TonB family protein [Sphingomonas daechungensis]QNP42969.1 TonB family protein [Sphingomonas daechungensis]
MIIRVLLVASVAFAGVSQSAFAAPPIGAWKVEASDLRCLVTRQYGDPKKPITLALKAAPTESTYQLAILRSGYRKGQLQSDATLTFDGQSFTESSLSYPTSGNKRVTHLINLGTAQSSAARTAKSVKIAIQEGLNDEFDLGPLPQPVLTELNGCVDRLQDRWNIGDERQAKLRAGATGNLQRTAVVSGDDYPLTSQRLNQQGSIRVLILVDETGMPKDCSVLQTSGSALLDSRTCGVIMERATFSPAIDQSGKPAKSSFTQRMSWRLEG